MDSLLRMIKLYDDRFAHNHIFLPMVEHAVNVQIDDAINKKYFHRKNLFKCYLPFLIDLKFDFRKNKRSI